MATTELATASTTDNSAREDQPLAQDVFARLPAGFSALVIGASGGIGQAMVEELLAHSRCARVLAVGRDTSRLPRHPALMTLDVDLTTDDGMAALGKWLAATLDDEQQQGQPPALTLNAMGLLHDEESELWPEKRLEDLDMSALIRVHQVNAFVPALLLSLLAPRLRRRTPLIFASLSARVGSISDNRSGGWYAYRASKASHNMLLHTAAIEIARRNPEALLVALHPGTTDTGLSAPFQARVPAGKLFSAGFVARRLLTVAGELSPEVSGGFHDWAGKPIAW
ncbi:MULTISPECIES: SDR family NAD(P)-dependent oxidoreductase [Cobetia]|uniref:SDR family NAD(P)-dependent oxidoreductase n=1 Tax=Cobetia crustatorum TaxID=553385 RepID=A0A558HU57_9GAMM|nr:MULTISPECIES: SDR family NAD(P)-dependent oxidoreductase [Cobetia]TVU72667.1 SDR family NAD(P)-dependent oxidoreductase [Cobetia crustatorum]